MEIAVIGGGINGLSVAWRMGLMAHNVDVYDSGRVLGRTSSSSSKLLHGGIRYLENGHIGLVRKSLIDRHWWLSHAPDCCHVIKMYMPVYEDSLRSCLTLFCGATVYRFLAGKYSLGPTSWHGIKETKLLCPDIEHAGLLGSVSFYDAQMNEEKLGNWVLKNAIKSGVSIFENSVVENFNNNGELYSSMVGNKKYDLLINAAGPWASKLNNCNNIESDFELELIRGSHLFLNTTVNNCYVLQEAGSKRIVFVLPYLGKTLVGTTEVLQELTEDIKCSSNERNYLLNIYNSNFQEKVSEKNITSEFSGVRSIVRKINRKKNSGFSSASREAAIEINNKLITIYGGKWTSAPSLARNVVVQSKKVRNH